MRRQNPLLKETYSANRQGFTLLHRHVLVDPRTVFTCPHLEFSFLHFKLSKGPGFQYMSKFSLEEHWHIHKKWYAFPYPSFYHGRMAQAPARTRRRGHEAYLWQMNAGLHGWAQNIRRTLAWECGNSSKCAPRSRLKVDTGDLKPPGINTSEVVSAMMRSTYCAHPPGDTPSRKGIIDSIVLGCVPVLFIEAQMNLWRAHFTSEEFASMVVFVPEEHIIGDPSGDSRKGGISMWEDRCKECSWRHWALRGRNETVHSLRPHKLEPILEQIPLSELHAKQDRIAALSHRVILQLEDSEEDSLAFMLNRVVRDATDAGWRLRRLAEAGAASTA